MENLKIACYGFVANEGGSCGKAHFLMLQELTKRGVEIDFFGWRGFNRAEELESYSNFNYIDLPSASPIGSWMGKLPSSVSKIVHPFLNILIDDSLHFRAMRDVMLYHHDSKKYDILIFLGLYAPFQLGTIPVISLIQGAVGAEWALIRKHKETIVKFCGSILYAKLKTYYVVKDKIAYTKIGCSDAILCTSEWTKAQVCKSGFDPKDIYVIPYPLELDRFSLRDGLSNKQSDQEKTLLCLGRLDPRKRLDLLLDAFALVLKERNNVRLKIIGGFNYVEGYCRMIEQFSSPEKIEYCASVPSSQIPELMQTCDLLIQPSEGENFGSSVAEALCRGLPVIIGPTNGTKDYLGDSSFVFEEYTSESLKIEIIRALDSLDRNLPALARESRTAAERNFNVIDIIDSLQCILSEVVSRKNGSRISAKPQLVEK
jgi:glycosyltransferase involved in cell wall biosynthesis